MTSPRSVIDILINSLRRPRHRPAAPPFAATRAPTPAERSIDPVLGGFLR